MAAKEKEKQMQHHFDIEVAAEYGIEAAVLINHFQFWIVKNAASGKHQHDGRTWTYNTAKAYAVLFPYMSEDKIKRLLRKLEELGVLVSGNHNKSHYDRTKWYAFKDEDKWLKSSGQKFPIDRAELPDGKDESARPIPDNNTDNNTDKNSITDSGKNYAFVGEVIRLNQADFDKWLTVYPHIPNLVTELRSADAYFAEHPSRDGKYYYRASEWLKKANNAASPPKMTEWEKLVIAHEGGLDPSKLR